MHALIVVEPQQSKQSQVSMELELLGYSDEMALPLLKYW